MSEIVVDPSLPAPEPQISSDTAVFWAAAAEGRLLIGRCRACGEAIWYPRPMCPFCHSMDTGWEEVSGRGTIYTFSIVRRGVGAYAKRDPYVLAYVELEEGPRVMTNIVECDLDALEIGQRVEVVFHRTAAGNGLARFRPA